MKLKISLLILTLAVLAGVSYILPYGEYVSLAVDWCNSFGTTGIVVFVILYAVLCMLLAPGSLITMAAGAVYGFTLGYVVVTAGSLLAASLSFILGRFVVKNYIAHWLEKYPRVTVVQKAISEKGPIIVFLMRLSPLFPFSISNYAFSLTTISFRNYFFVSWVGMIPGTILYVYLGVLGKSMVQSQEATVGKLVLLVAGGVATLLLTIIIASIARKALTSELKT